MFEGDALAANTVSIGVTLVVVLWFVLKAEQKRFAFLWCLGAASHLVSHMALLRDETHHTLFLLVVVHIFRSFGNLLVLWGLLDYLRRPLLKRWLFLFAGSLLWILYAALTGLPPPLVEWGSRAFAGAIYWWAGLAVYRLTSLPLGSRLCLAGLLALWGLYSVVRPFIPSLPHLSGPIGLLVALGFITVYLRTARERAQEEAFKFRMIFDNANDAIVLVESVSGDGREDRVVEANAVACQLTGYAREEIMALRLQDLLGPDGVRRLPSNELTAGTKVTFEATCRSRQGRRIPIEVSASQFSLHGKQVWLGVIRDITERQKAEEEIRYLSYHDRLTGLYNRAFLEKELKRLDCKVHLPLSLIVADLNGLKFVNDVFGHQEGDKLIVRFAHVLKRKARGRNVIVRWGGDEFLILMPNSGPETARDLCRRIAEACRERELGVSLGTETKLVAEENILDVLRRAEDEMYRQKFLETKEPRDQAALVFQAALAEGAHETEGHVARMRVMAQRLGERLGLDRKHLDQLELLAVLHDIGKIAVAEDILLKPGKLTPVEWETMKRHCEVGYRIARTSPEFEPIAGLILSHHERWDGEGYPQGLARADIPLAARMIAVLDAYDAMTSDRPYHEALSQAQAIEELRRCSGTQFDPAIVDQFLSVLRAVDGSAETAAGNAES